MQTNPIHKEESQKFIYVSRYARWRDDLGRRETWEETVSRYVSYMKNHIKLRFDDKVPAKVWSKIDESILKMNVLPSMRAMWAAGETLDRNNLAGYNCTYRAFDSIYAPVDVFMVLMCGCGAGFSVEDQYISKMPVVKQYSAQGRGIFVIEDSREGWAASLAFGLETWFEGEDVDFDYSKIRGRGARLKTMGGRASGPEPLMKLHQFCRDTIQKAAGRKLTDIEWLDIGNMIADCVVVGGVRRSAEISFSDRASKAMRHAKDVPCPPHRCNSNNTSVYNGRPSMVDFMEEWAALAKSGTGERAIYNLAAALKHIPKRRKHDVNLRTNPCAEILLRNQGVCNLSEVVIRAEDEFDDLVQKVEVAVWIGAIQATLTNFPSVSEGFKKNAEEERLLGVSLTGQFDNPGLLTAERLSDLRKYAVKVAKRASEALGINMPVAVTCVKPSGTVSQLVNSSSGAHPRYAPFYLRRYRIAATDPLYRMMKDQGFKFYPENGQEKWPEKRVTTWVCEFPVEAPKGAVTRNDLTAIQQLEWYLKIQNNWSEHNVSITVYVKDEEWLEVGAWVYAHFEELIAVSFLPHSDAAYRLAPYEEITKSQYEKLVKEMPLVDYSQLSRYELEDQGEGSREFACVSGACEL